MRFVVGLETDFDDEARRPGQRFTGDRERVTDAVRELCEIAWRSPEDAAQQTRIEADARAAIEGRLGHELADGDEDTRDGFLDGRIDPGPEAWQSFAEAVEYWLLRR